MAIKLVGHTMPTSMSARAANYIYTQAEIIGTNGEGDDIESAQGASVVWQWAHLNAAEWDYLYTTVLAGAPSVRATLAGNTVVYDNQRTEKAFNHAVVHRPQYKVLSGTDYQEVTILIDNLR
jgi:hypothetical protein